MYHYLSISGLYVHFLVHVKLEWWFLFFIFWLCFKRFQVYFSLRLVTKYASNKMKHLTLMEWWKPRFYSPKPPQIVSKKCTLYCIFDCVLKLSEGCNLSVRNWEMCETVRSVDPYALHRSRIFDTFSEFFLRVQSTIREFLECWNVLFSEGFHNSFKIIKV